jgi:hypothetical protein
MNRDKTKSWVQVHYKSWMNIQMNEPHGIGIHDTNFFHIQVVGLQFHYWITLWSQKNWTIVQVKHDLVRVHVICHLVESSSNNNSVILKFVNSQ